MKVKDVIFWVIVLFSLLVFLFPLLNVISIAFKRDIDIVSMPPRIIFRPVLDHFRIAFATGGYHFDRYFINSILISTLSTLLTLGITILPAYSVSRYNVGGKSFLNFIISLRFFPPILFTIPFYILFSRMNLTDTILGIAITHTLMNVPIVFPIMVSFIDEVPKSIEEAAFIDGCSTWSLLGRILLPLISPGLVSIAFINFIFSWNEYLMALILSSGKATPITVGAGLFIRSFGVKYGELAAVTTVALIPPLAIAVILRRHIIRGLTMGIVIKG